MLLYQLFLYNTNNKTQPPLQLLQIFLILFKLEPIYPILHFIFPNSITQLLPLKLAFMYDVGLFFAMIQTLTNLV